MKHLVIAAFLGAGVLASPRALVAPNFAGSLSKLSWTGTVKPGEPSMNIVGTAEEIYQQIIKVNPNYDTELGINSGNATANARQLAGIDKRAPPVGVTSSNYNCGYGTYVSVDPIDVGIQYLYNIGSGTCAAPAGAPGAGGCSRVSCSEAAGIWLCNDNSFEIDVPCNIVADNAVEILIKCQYTNYVSSNWVSYVRGQIFSIDGTWNVIINTPGASC